MFHYLIGYDKHEQNLNLCGRHGAATNSRKIVTCKKCKTLLKKKVVKKGGENAKNNSRKNRN